MRMMVVRGEWGKEMGNHLLCVDDGRLQTLEESQRDQERQKETNLERRNSDVCRVRVQLFFCVLFVIAFPYCMCVSNCLRSGRRRALRQHNLIARVRKVITGRKERSLILLR